MPHIIITRDVEGGRRLQQLLSLPAAHITLAPLWRIEPLAAPEHIHHQHIILTSQHALHACAAANFQESTFYVIGEQSKAQLKACGANHVYSFADAAALLAHILSADKNTSYLYLRARHVSLDISSIANSHGVQVDECVVYANEPITQGIPAFSQALQTHAHAVLPVFSIRTATHMAEVMKAHAPAHISNSTLIAISPAVADAVVGYAWKKIYIAETADLHSMADATMLALQQEIL